MKLWIPLILSLAACTGSSTPAPAEPDGGEPDAAPQTVEESLDAFGVDRTVSDRLSPEGTPYPNDWAPFGDKAQFGQLEELILAGADLTDAPGFTSNHILNTASYIEPGRGSLREFPPDAEGEGPYTASGGSGAEYASRPVGGDFDGDGLGEVCWVWWSEVTSTTRLRITDDETNGAAVLVDVALQDPNGDKVIDVLVADFDGDGRDDIVYALGGTLVGELRWTIVTWDGGDSLRTLRETETIDAIYDTIIIQFAVGRGDRDRLPELALMLTQHRFSSNTGEASYRLFDDFSTGFQELKSGRIEEVKVADIAMGDIDGDGLDEILIGGLTAIGSLQTLTDGRMNYHIEAFDDATHAHAELGSFTSPLVNETGRADAGMWWAHATPVDFDGDGVPLLCVGHRLFTFEGGTWSLEAQLPFRDVILDSSPRASGYRWFLSEACAGCFLEPDRQVLVTYSAGPAYEDSRQAIFVWTYDGRIEEARRYLRQPGGGSTSLAVANVNADTTVMRRVPDSHRLVFTEPIIVAVLAAAPYGPQQDPSKSITSYGIGEVSGATRSESLTVSTGSAIGFDNGRGPFSLGLSSEKSEAITRESRMTYELESSLTWSTGPAEDSVVFTSIPYDQYEYVIVVDAEDPTRTGQTIVVSVPRTPKTLLTTIDFYRRHVVEGSPRVDRIFGHTPGDPQSYPTAPVGPSMRPGSLLESRLFSVGEGSGVTTVFLRVSESTGTTELEANGWSRDVQATAFGFVAGFDAGGERGTSISIDHGTSMTFQGQVGALSGQDFIDLRYDLALFTYVYEDAASGQAFRVLNFWVD